MATHTPSLEKTAQNSLPSYGSDNEFLFLVTMNSTLTLKTIPHKISTYVA
jgi:hypothetical protein